MKAIGRSRAEWVTRYIDVDGRKFRTQFDPGAQNSYVVPRVGRLLVTSKLSSAYRCQLGGRSQRVTQAALLEADIEGHRISTFAFVIDDIGKDEGGETIEVLVGVLAMRQWGIHLIPDQNGLDLSLYPRMIVEF